MHQGYGRRRSRAYPREERADRDLVSTDEDNTSTDDTDDRSSDASASSGSGRRRSRQKSTEADDYDDYDDDGYARRTRAQGTRRVSMTLVWIVVGAALVVLAAIGSVGYMMLGDGRLSEGERTIDAGDQNSSLAAAETRINSSRSASSDMSGTSTGSSSAKDRRPTGTGTSAESTAADSEEPNSNRPSATKEQARPTDSKSLEETLNNQASPPPKPKPSDHPKSPPALKGGKKGVGYNDAGYANQLAISWGYNWARTTEPLAEGVEYVPMLWDEDAKDWKENARKAIANGATALLGFNEPDLAEQADMSVTQAVDVWRAELEPLKDEFPHVKLVSPAVTNGIGTDAKPMGVPWLKQFLSECKGCRIDAVALHWYDSADNTPYFYKHFEEAQAALKKPIWVTEFMGLGAPDQQKRFLQEVVPWLEQQSWVERYAAFGCFSADPIANFFDGGGKVNELGKVYSGL